MKKLLLLDADVIIDLHTLDLFERILRTYDVYVTRTVLKEARFFKRAGRREKMFKRCVEEGKILRLHHKILT